MLYYIEKKEKETSLLQQTNLYSTQRFHFLTFSYLLKEMVLPLIMKTEKNVK